LPYAHAIQRHRWSFDAASLPFVVINLQQKLNLSKKENVEKNYRHLLLDDARQKMDSFA
jgi:hypothetical protein